MQNPRRFSLALLALAILAAVISQTTVATALPKNDAEESAAESPETPAARSPDVLAKVDAEARRLLTAARDRLFQYSSVQARIAEQVSFPGRKFNAQGTYIAGPFPALRLEYEVQVGQTTGKLLQVCDGQILRTRREIGQVGGDTASAAGAVSDSARSTIQVTRRDIQQILRATQHRQQVPEAVLAAELGLGGLPALLAAIEKSMTFDAIRTEEFDGRNYRVIQGKWSDAFMTTLNEQLRTGVPGMQQFIPDRIRIYLDDENLFPGRILYLKESSDDGQRRTYRPLLSLEFRDVVINAPVDPDTFRYQAPPGVDEVDETKEYLKLIEGADIASEEAST
ncbi:MAG: outer membrane lipoprotein carrier protein LolA, partial [Maioricimonas sp. JB049]